MNLLRILDSTPEPPIVDLHLDNVNDSGEYHLATPMYEFQKELTDQIVSLHYSDILKYCETNDETELIIKSLQICIENCMIVSTHPYLLINHYMPKNLLQKDMAMKLAETSGKFTVLKDLIAVLIRHARTLKSPRHVGIVMNSNVKLFDLIEALLVGYTSNQVKIKRYLGNYLKRDKKNDASESNLTIHLMPYDRVVAELSTIKFEFIVVLDSYVDINNEFVSKIRKQNRRNEASIIRLIPMNTIEHCNLFYQNSVQDQDYLYKLISSIVCLRDQVGVLPPDIFPIYNQGLNYLSPFMEDVFRSSRYPTWPLPELPPIPRFSAIDVEKSLLTEVLFHYTPYDADVITDDNKPAMKKTYYETKRLKSNYITNPLTNNFEKLIGIFPHQSTIANKHPNFLTHKEIMMLNSSCLNLDRAVQEYESYTTFNEPETQARIGRREDESKKTLTAILGDLDHVNSRIDANKRKTVKRQEEIEAVKKQIEELQAQYDNFQATEARKELINNQTKIWAMQKSVQENLNKIKSKTEERNYIKNEFENSLESIKTSHTKIAELKEQKTQLEKRLENFEANDVEEVKNYRLDRNVLIGKINHERDQNTLYRKRLAKSLKFLSESSHLKKRKGRGITPK